MNTNHLPRPLLVAVRKCALTVISIAAFAITAAAQTNTFPTSGNAGIGTTSPGDALQIVRDNGGLTLDTATSGTIVPVFKFSTTGTGRASIQFRPDLPGLSFQTGGFAYPAQTKMVLTDTGFLGLGTTTPGRKLEILAPDGEALRVYRNAANVGWGVNMVFAFNNSSGQQRDYAGVHGLIQSSTAGSEQGSLILSTATGGALTEKLRVDSSGKVGIGTTAPDSFAKLHLYSSGGFGQDIQTSTNDWTRLRFVTPTRTWGFFLDGGSAGLGAGKFGLYDYTANAWRLVTDTNGNVGVGTSSPAYKLDVAGEIRSSSGGFRFPDGSLQTTAASGGGGGVTSVFGRTGAVVAATNDYTWAQINKSAANAGDLAAGTLLAARMPALTGDVTTSVGTVATTLSNTGVSAGSYTNANITVNAKGRITAASNGSGGSTAFSSITAGTNTVALVVGNSGSLGVSGTGTINATSLTNAANITSGTVPIARLGTGTPDSTKFLRGDNTWTAITSSQWTTSGSNINYATAGNVGIGVTGTPAEKLHVVGNGKITGNLTVDGSINAKYQDLAEWVPSSEQLSTGTVVVLDTTKSNQVISSGTAYDTRVAGVISAQPGITLGEGGEGKVLVATTGRVRVKVDASRGAIQIGDLLVTSDVPGVAMKSEAVNLGGVQIHRPGTIIGKALAPLAKGTGAILVLLSLQ